MSTKRWTKEEEDFLELNFEKLSNKDLAEKFNVSEIAIQRKLARLSCHRQKQKKWTKEDEIFLKKNYMKYSDKELSDRFSVSEVAIKRKLHRLKLSRAQKRKEKAETFKVKAAPIVKIKNETTRIVKSNVEVYNIGKKNYELNQKIFHQIWKDEGVVKNLFQTREGNSAMLVDFKRMGEKVLIFGIND
ncbi:MAG: hypothetical protein PHW04_01855 [Candidatus Wallbacteria bacterium]|nr:hypothetical protein [Candidatus Wallbacteria bacterium]